MITTVTLCAVLAIGVTGCARYRAAQAEQTYPPVGQFAEVTGGQVHYVQKGSGPHLILLHGAGGNLREFTFDLMDRLTDRYTVTAFDRPGMGYTDRVQGVETGPVATEGDSPLQQARMLREAATALGITDPIVAGHSFGGIVAYAWAVEGLDSDNPVNAKALVSLAGVTMPWPGDLDPYYTINGSAFGGLVTVPLIAALTPPSVVRSRIEGTFAPQPAPDGYAEHIGAGLTLRQDSFRANIRQVNTLRAHVVELSKRYPDLTLPIEIVHGNADDTVPINIHAEVVIEIVPSANLTALDGVGHMPHHAAPEVVTTAIDRAATRAKLR
ncbi:alpha/beta fold hydrolase [Yoonia sediminilitoris]|uniref:Pimeloyl-ACP methyl ester carboxylesterase n=1 Tax=Yoonia sediminilitoris TaxID=1286148 RepID=A0A2T6KCT9_9RHOB|nr:alpha/beta hydrolase [Yoonia sediminilitoris]PUB12740.1 pimeloyl-ACP methyl ester carboxylesterase [Yoonia sediminilitoris]RCW94219.1 pimeloyl-ACP methyl ester carboxylesterase [Yoonia sediminilitoris]